MGWIDTGDGGYNWFKCGSKWSGCTRQGHETIAELRACFAWGYRQAKEGDKVWPCSWLLEGRYDDGSIFTYECAALSYEIEGGYECERGHEHHDQQWMHEHGMAYASDEEDAVVLAKRGITAVLPNGNVVGAAF